MIALSLTSLFWFFLLNKAYPRKPFYPHSGPRPSSSLRSGNSNQNTSKPKPPGENKGHNPLSQPIAIIANNQVKENGKKPQGLKPTGITF